MLKSREFVFLSCPLNTFTGNLAQKPVSKLNLLRNKRICDIGKTKKMPQTQDKAEPNKIIPNEKPTNLMDSNNSMASQEKDDDQNENQKKDSKGSHFEHLCVNFIKFMSEGNVITSVCH